MVSAIAVDLDGTIINNEKKISEKDRNAIMKARELGIKIIVCTGRPPSSAIEFAKDLSGSSTGNYVIAFNGAAIMDVSKEEIIKSFLLPNDLADPIVDVANELDYLVIGFGKDKYFANMGGDDLTGYIDRVKIPIEIDKNFNKKYKNDYYNILIKNSNRQALEKAKDMLHDYAQGKMNMMYSASVLLEFFNLNATKGNALKSLSSLLSIPLSNILAIGDNFNDISMLKEAGYSAAVANSEDEVKAIAGYVAKNDNNNSAVSEIIEKFIFNS